MSLSYSSDGASVIVQMVGDGPPQRDPWTRQISQETVVLRDKLTLDEAKRHYERLAIAIAEAAERYDARAAKEDEFERLRKELGK